MKAEPGFIKVRQCGQSTGDPSGWDKHINKFPRPASNKVVNRLLTRDTDGLDRKYRE